MKEQGHSQEAHNPEAIEQKERIQRALLTPADTWLGDLCAYDFGNSELAENLNNHLQHSEYQALNPKLVTLSDSQQAKHARRAFFGTLMCVAHSMEIMHALEKLQKIQAPPTDFVANMRVIYSENLDVARMLSKRTELFYYRHLDPATIRAYKDLYGSEKALSLLYERPLLMIKEKDNVYSYHSALAKLDTLMFGSEPKSPLNENGRLLTASVAKLFAVARIALEANDATELSASKFATAATQPLDTHMLALLSEDEQYDSSKPQRYRRSTDRVSRREQVLSLLTPENSQRLGRKILYAYFRAKPLTKAETAQHQDLARGFEVQFRHYDQSSRNQDLIIGADQFQGMQYRDNAATVDELAIDELNRDIWAGAKVLRKQPTRKAVDAVVAARQNVLRKLGWNKPGHPLNDRFDENTFKIRPDTAIILWHIATDHGYDPVDFLATCPVKAFEMSRDRVRAIRKVLQVYHERGGEQLDAHFMRAVIRGSLLAHVAVLAAGAQSPRAGATYEQERSLAGVKSDIRALLNNADAGDTELIPRGLKLL